MTFSFNDDFIGYAETNTVCDYTGSDNKENFQRRLQEKPASWIYRTLPISYTRNSRGHRSKEIEELNTDNYFLVSGCSHTEGVGLPQDAVYSSLLSKLSGYDFYNLGLGGTGMDVASYNLLTWRAKINKQPKFIILQIPEYARFVRPEENRGSTENEYMSSIMMREEGAWSMKYNKEIENFLVSGSIIDYFQFKSKLLIRTIKNIFNCPVITIAVGSKINADFHFEFMDEARDGHPGMDTHKCIAETLYSHITSPKINMCLRKDST